MIFHLSQATGASVRMICQTLEVPRSSYYHSSKPTPSQLKNEALGDLIEEIFNEHLRRYGYRRIHQELQRRNVHCGTRRVQRLMKSRNLQALQPKSFKPTTSDGRAAPSPNLIGDTLPKEPGQAWAGDITYVRTTRGWVYMAVVIDLCTRKALGWAVADHMRAELVTEALTQALGNNYCCPDAIFHSDRGSQYGSRLFRGALKKAGMRQSMSRRANPYDNAWTESFIGTYKHEHVQGGEFEDADGVRESAFDYFAGYYNTRRLHSALDYKTPISYELELFAQN